MTSEIQNTQILETEADVEFGVVDCQPQEEQVVSAIREWLDIEDVRHLRIYGTDAQRTSMFKSWAGYFGMVDNPDATKQNTFTKSNYAPLNEVLNAARSALSLNGLSISQVPMNGDGGWVYTQTLILHEDGGFMVFPPFGMQAIKADAQGVMAAMTYARRGALNAILGIHGEEDTDGNDLVKKPASKPAADTKLVAKQEEALAVMLKASQTIDREKVFDACNSICGSKNPNKLKSVQDCDTLISKINEMLK